MLARRCFLFLLVLALALFSPACACAPDRWTLAVKRDWDARTGRPTQNEVSVSISGPIPTFRHE